uniref:Uncharacterized protein n=1 Tax=Arion vulgaris TaxID=1028688 RepID=A0A0B7B7E9_9EUPU
MENYVMKSNLLEKRSDQYKDAVQLMQHSLYQVFLEYGLTLAYRMVLKNWSVIIDSHQHIWSIDHWEMKIRNKEQWHRGKYTRWECICSFKKEYNVSTFNSQHAFP